jgi:trimeric autotransporter adhesin
MRMVRLFARISLGILFALLATAQVSPVPGNNVINTVAGGATPTGAALSADLGDVVSAVKDASGNIYLSTALSYVFKLDPSGNLSTFAGTGWEGFGGAGGPTSRATLGLPRGLALDAAGDIFIADSNGHVWKAIKSSGDLINIAGNTTFQNPYGGYSGDGGPAIQAQLSSAYDVALATNGTMYVVDRGNEVIRSITNGIINTYAGTPFTICPDPTATPACGDGGPALSATFYLPQRATVDASGNLYIADTFDNRVRRVDTHGIITTVAGNGFACVLANCGDGLPATQANVFHPEKVLVDSAGDLYITGQYENRIRFVNAKTQKITTIVGTGDFGFSGDGGPATAALLSNPSGIFLDSAGNLLIADTGNRRVREVSGGIINTIAGGGMGGDNGPATGAVLCQPLTLSLDASGNQFVVDTCGSRIRRIDATTQQITTVAGTGDAGYKGYGGPATSASLNYPDGVAVDNAGNLYITDPGNAAVQRVDASSGIMSVFAGTLFVQCLITTDPCGDGGPATSATVWDPAGIVVDSAGNVFIDDLQLSRIRCVIGALGGCGDTQQIYPIGTILTVAGNGITCSSPPSCGDGGPATSANLSNPYGIALDQSGNLFIADTYDNLVRRVDAVSQTITTVALNGQPTFGGDGGPALNASMAYPEGIGVDPSGNVFIGGGLDEVVRRVDAATQTITTVAGNAADPIPYGFKGDGGLATKATLDNFGLAVDGSGDVYIADVGSNRIRAVHLAPKASLTTTSVNFGDQILDTTSSPVEIPFSNTGLNDLQITSITVTGSFAQTNTCGNLLAPSLTCNLSITFTPTTLGVRQGTVTISDNGGTQKITLTGTGVGK